MSADTFVFALKIFMVDSTVKWTIKFREGEKRKKKMMKMKKIVWIFDAICCLRTQNK